MIVPVQYRYVTWSPPYLTEEQQLELGRQIALQGRDHWVREFRESIGKPKPDEQRPKPSAGAFYFGILFLAGMIYFYAFTEDGRQLAARKLLPALIPIMIIAMSIWFGSVYLATRRFEKWVDSLVAKYAAHVARGGH